MARLARFAVVSDLHIALPHTVWDSPHRFHLVEVSILAFEQILDHLEQVDIDFLLLPGDLVQHGERENHEWLVRRLEQLPFPVYVVPGNHDVVRYGGCDRTVSLDEFTHLYQAFGYSEPSRPYYHHQILDGLHLIGLNSNGFDPDGEPFYTGWLDPEQLAWLDEQLAQPTDQLTLVMLHHHALEHLPHQSRSAMGQRYMVKNASDLTQRLQAAQMPIMFTGHLHIQDVAQAHQLYEVTTGSLVSYPHPYRICELTTADSGHRLDITSRRIKAVPDWPTLQATSRQWMADRSLPFMVKLLMGQPLQLSSTEAEQYAPVLQDFWAGIADGDALFDFPELPTQVQRYLRTFSATTADGQPHPIDNDATLWLQTSNLNSLGNTSSYSNVEK
ncbi:metallophosphoesterase [Leptolyngbya cf. ectocarpi LEGE 11479]|uniref:Metallophosphoesterase n=1 Tax=Leptolyngbya cf. ectocarpi LEGE 11479 TaxID=1828722 RepID=A0A928X072_LEPEC|nr:metallophosphoesterase [Leptolyngbya ectocarpi]MBE9066062.1 metallophosphoesterase [Leptolyngbya cf. ectocarpi LEGE 11479]